MQLNSAKICFVCEKPIEGKITKLYCGRACMWRASKRKSRAKKPSELKRPVDFVAKRAQQKAAYLAKRIELSKQHVYEIGDVLSFGKNYIGTVIHYIREGQSVWYGYQQCLDINPELVPIAGKALESTAPSVTPRYFIQAKVGNRQICFCPQLANIHGKVI